MNRGGGLLRLVTTPTYVRELLSEFPDLEHGFVPEGVPGAELLGAASVLTRPHHTK